jgi:4-amino-4-deoxy-L-arabinose transferase-like glycosyltransferase
VRDIAASRAVAWVVVAAALLRLAWPGSWPEVLPDEGLWTSSAKNFFLFGDWFMDERTHVFLSPIFHALSLLSFAILGPSIAAARVVSGVAGTLSVWILYRLVRRLSGRADLALGAAVFLGVNEFMVNLSRQAMTEPLQLAFVLASAWLLSAGNRRHAAAGALLLALGLLTKVNLLPVAVALAIHQAFPRWEGWLPKAADGRRAALFLAGSLALAGLGYALLWQLSPERFVSAFGFALGPEVIEPGTQPVVQVGRLGLDPELVARTILAIFRDSPFLMVLATVGVALSLGSKPRGIELFGPWLAVGGVAQLLQVYQPTRYFYLLTPPLCFFAAHAVYSLTLEVRPGRPRAPTLALGAYLAFNVPFVVLNAVANPASKIATLRGWVSEHVEDGDRILAASYLCTDLPQRAYGHYHLAGSPAELLESIETYRIDWVIQDDQEWKPELRAILDERFPEAARLPFGRVYRVPRPD